MSNDSMSNNSAPIPGGVADSRSSRARLSYCLATIVLAVTASALSAHEGHQDNMSDADMVAMEHDMSSPRAMHARAMHDGGDVRDRGLAADADEHGSLDNGRGADAPSTNAHQTISPEQILQQKIEENRVRSLGDLLGRLHPIAAHFPIALLIFAALGELALMIRPTLGIESATRLLVAGGAIGAVVAAFLGWFAGGWRLTDRSETLAIHRWNGTAPAFASLLAWWLAARGQSPLALRVVLTLIAAGLVVQGYLGGEMVFGPNHLGLM